MVDLADVLRDRPYTQQMTGLVTAVSTGSTATATTVTVDTGGQIAAGVRCLTGTAPVVGDVVLLLISDRRLYVMGKLSHPTTPPPLPPPLPEDTTGTSVFPAVSAGTYLDGVRRVDRTDVIQGPDPQTGKTNVGVWRYGGIPAGTLAGATVTAAALWLTRWPPTPAADVTAGLVLLDAAEPPVVLDSTPVPGIDGAYAGWVDVPVDWAADLIDPALPAAALGVSTPDPAHYAAFASLTADPQSGALSITWSR